MAASAGRHVLCQKPFALEMGQARLMVEAAEAAGVLLAVNQQLRWDAGFAASRDLIAKGAIGRATVAQIAVSASAGWHHWPWLAPAPRLEIMYHSIHYLDAIRSVLGEPEWITSIHGRFPEQAPVVGETLTTTVLEYPDGLQALIAMNHYDQHGTPSGTFKFLGTMGALEGTIGQLYDLPDGRPDTLTPPIGHVAGGLRFRPTLVSRCLPGSHERPDGRDRHEPHTEVVRSGQLAHARSGLRCLSLRSRTAQHPRRELAQRVKIVPTTSAASSEASQAMMLAMPSGRMRLAISAS